jgi:hypothetical protein
MMGGPKQIASLNLLRHTLVLLALCVLAHAAGARAEMIYLKARLLAPSGAASDGDGAALFAYDTGTRALAWTVSYRKLSEPVTGAHLHGPATPEEEAPVVVPIAMSASPISGGATLTSGQAADMIAGRWYIDLHTSADPDGEIRGQVEVIDTNEYGFNWGYPAGGVAFVAGSATLVLPTSQLSWRIGWGKPLLHHISGVGLFGPAKGSEFGPKVFDGDTGSATLTAEQTAQFVNGFWHFLVGDVNGTFGAYGLPRYPQLFSLSTRLQVQQQDGVAIAGFIIDDPYPKGVVITARGPSLADGGVSNPLADPKLTLVRASDQAVIGTNDDWTDTFNSFYLGPMRLGEKESAILATLAPGAYTAIVEGADGGSGVALVAVSDFNAPYASMLGISTRGQVLTGDQVMIAGFIIDGNGPKTVVIRARGPSLGLARGGLRNPMLQLVRGSDQAIIAVNDDWPMASNAAQIQGADYTPSDPLESAIMITLEPGAYTAIVSGVDGATGVALVEVFEKVR